MHHATCLQSLCSCSVTEDPNPRPQSGTALPVQATVAANGSDPITGVTLYYLVYYGSTVSVPMTAGANGKSLSGIVMGLKEQFIFLNGLQ